MISRLVSLPIVFLSLSGIGISGTFEPSTVKNGSEEKMRLRISSSAFKHEGIIPRQYTCDGKDISPPLAWEGSPSETKSFALICDDPDAPMGSWVHWVLFNIPPKTGELKEEFPHDQSLKDGSRNGVNSWGKLGYGGPCPPGGLHRYFFKLYALDRTLDLTGKVTKEQLLSAMKGHVLAEAELMGRYSRK